MPIRSLHTSRLCCTLFKQLAVTRSFVSMASTSLTSLTSTVQLNNGLELPVVGLAFDRTLAAVKQSVQHVGFPNLDLILLHAPGTAGRAEAWRALEEAQNQGLVRSIGVSNFGIGHLDKLAANAKVPPAVNQIELHPWLQWRDEVQHCKAKGIVLQAYSPLAKASKLSDPQLVSLAKEINKTPAQVLLRWSLQKGFVPLPKSVNPERQAANADLFGWQLSEAQVAVLDGLEQGLVTGWNPIREHDV